MPESYKRRASLTILSSLRSLTEKERDFSSHSSKTSVALGEDEIGSLLLLLTSLRSKCSSTSPRGEFDEGSAKEGKEGKQGARERDQEEREL
jgi:hypothetical protein